MSLLKHNRALRVAIQNHQPDKQSDVGWKQGTPPIGNYQQQQQQQYQQHAAPSQQVGWNQPAGECSLSFVIFSQDRTRSQTSIMEQAWSISRIMIIVNFQWHQDSKIWMPSLSVSIWSVVKLSHSIPGLPPLGPSTSSASTTPGTASARSYYDQPHPSNRDSIASSQPSTSGATPKERYGNPIM